MRGALILDTPPFGMQGASLSSAYSNCGNAKQLKGDLDGAIADYNRALELDPQDVIVHMSRGLVRYYKSEFSLAATDFPRAQQLYPDAYASIWLFLARSRGGSDGKNELTTNSAELDNAKWPAPIVALYLDKDTPATVLKGAEHPNAKISKEQRCEANFYVGQWQVLKGDPAKATLSLRVARDQCPKDQSNTPARCTNSSASASVNIPGCTVPLGTLKNSDPAARRSAQGRKKRVESS